MCKYASLRSMEAVQEPVLRDFKIPAIVSIRNRSGRMNLPSGFRLIIGRQNPVFLGAERKACPISCKRVSLLALLCGTGILLIKLLTGGMSVNSNW